MAVAAKSATEISRLHNLLEKFSDKQKMSDAILHQNMNSIIHILKLQKSKIKHHCTPSSFKLTFICNPTQGAIPR